MFLGLIFSVGLGSKRDKKSTAVFVLPGFCAIVKLKCGRKAHAFHKGGEFNLV